MTPLPSGHDHPRFRRAFLVIYGLTTMLLALVALPFADPDGYVHWWRMQALAEGQLLPDTTPKGTSGIAVEVSDGALKQRLVPFITRTDSKVWPRQWIDIVALTDQPAKTVQYEGAGAFSSAPFFYAIPTILSAGADLLVSSEYGAVIAYRILFVLLSLVVIAWVLPSSPLAIAAFLCVPMVQFLVATGHMDAVVLLALMTAAVLSRRKPSWLAAPILIFASKSAVALFAPFFLIVAHGWKRGLLYSVAVMALIVAFYGLYMKWLGPLVDARVHDGVDPAGQVQALLTNPLVVLQIAGDTLSYSGLGYLSSMVGLLGWLDAAVPLWAYAAVVLITLAIIVTHQLPWSTLLAWLVVSLLYCGATFAALYVTWTPVGMMNVLGVQGRYFLPVFAAVVPLLAARWDLTRFAPLALLLVGAALQLQTLYTIADRYYHLDMIPDYLGLLMELWT